MLTTNQLVRKTKKGS